MSFERFKTSARRTIRSFESLTRPISTVESGHWSEELRLDGSSHPTDLGAVELRGSVNTALHLTHRPTPPRDLDRIRAVPDESEYVIASLVIRSEAGAQLNQHQRLGTGVGVDAGAEVAAEFACAQHRRYPLEATGLQVLTEFLQHVRNPFSLTQLGEHELFHIEFSGAGKFVASAGWEWGLVRSFQGTELEKLVPGDLGGVSAGVKAGVSVQVGVDGQFRVFADRSPRDPRQVRVRLYRKRNLFIGAGLSISTTVRLAQPESFVESIFARLLQIPDGFVAEITELERELAELRRKLADLSREAKREIAEVIAVGEDALGLDHLDRLRSTTDDLPPRVRNHLAPFLAPLETVTDRIDELGDDLTKFVDDMFHKVSDPLDRLASRAETWIGAYSRARGQALVFIQERARHGIEADVAAGVNRTKTSEVLLELDFDPGFAPGFLREALKGDFIPALERARTPGATGVEIIGGTLKKTTEANRFFNLRLNLFGFDVRVDFQRWNRVELETDAATGVLSISGKSGASLEGSTNRRRNELSFLFDVYGAAERRGDRIYTTDAIRFKATVARTGEIRSRSQARAMIPRHLNGARSLNLIGSERRVELESVLLGTSDPTYRYEIELAFPPSSISRMFSLDLDESDKQLRDRLWRWMQQAVKALDYPVPHQSGVVPLSGFFDERSIALVNSKPTAAGWTGLRHVRGPNNELFQGGAYRMVWAYLLNANAFIAGYLATRQALLEAERLERVQKKLTKLAARTVRGAGTFPTRPFDSKYVVFALAEGLKEVEVRMCFRRGPVDVTI